METIDGRLLRNHTGFVHKSVVLNLLIRIRKIVLQSHTSGTVDSFSAGHYFSVRIVRLRNSILLMPNFTLVWKSVNVFLSIHTFHDNQGP